MAFLSSEKVTSPLLINTGEFQVVSGRIITYRGTCNPHPTNKEIKSPISIMHISDIEGRVERVLKCPAQTEGWMSIKCGLNPAGLTCPNTSICKNFPRLPKKMKPKMRPNSDAEETNKNTISEMQKAYLNL